MIKFWTKAVTATLLIAIVSGCASYKMHIKERPPIDVVMPGPDKLLNRLYLVGDAGALNEGSRTNMDLLNRMLKESETPNKVFFLGDNIYPVGMPKDSAERETAEKILLRQVDAVKENADEVIFVPGNHDWANGQSKGLKQIKRQAQFLKKLKLKNVSMLPEKGCPGPEVIHIEDDYALIIIDSQWWLQDWDRTGNMNEHCDIKTRHEFASEFGNAVRENLDRQIIVMMHHPLHTYGSHGGFYTFKDHMFPLTRVSKNLYIPLPILGSIYPLGRGLIGNVQDIPHHKYGDMKKALLTEIGEAKDVIFVSGHDHALQYSVHDDEHFIVSGSGSKTTAIGNGAELEFGHAHVGFFTLDCYTDGIMELQAWETTEDGKGKSVFSKIIKGPDNVEKVGPIPVDKESLALDSIEVSISGEYEKGKLFRFLLGEHYRDIYKMPVKAKVLDLEKEKGGLKVVQKGGGFQTKSLRLETEEGQQYVVRGLRKDASGLLPDIFQGTFALEVLQDQLTASHPYGAFVIPPMAEAAEIYHTNPEVRYLPSQAGLGKHSEEFGGKLYLFEERPNGDGSKIPGFGGAKEIMSYSDVIEQLSENHNRFADQSFVVRSRIFDMFIGDWDRHDDQWRWAEFKEKGRRIYRPIPRDRDQALSDYDGFISRLAYSYLPAFRKFGPFEDDISRIRWFNYNARWFDRYFMNELTKEEWIEAAKIVEAGMTDDILESAFSVWPQDVYNRDAEQIIAKLKVRRTKLVEWATEYYDYMAQQVDVRGTFKKDLFQIVRHDDGKTEVSVFRLKDGEKREQQYHRIFLPEETKEIRVYGLEGDDLFEIMGPSSSGIKVRLIGGDGHDRFTDVEKASISSRGRVFVYDEHKPENERNNLADGSKYKEVEEDISEYDRFGFQPDFGMPLFEFGFNPDNGMIIGGGWFWQNQGFMKDPYGSKHSLAASYSLGTQALEFNYDAEWLSVIGKSDFVLNAKVEGPSYVQNFYGIGNENEGPNKEVGRDYYRVIKRTYGLYPTVRKRFDGRRGNFAFNILAERVNIQETEGRIITDPQFDFDPSIFEGKTFGGATLSFGLTVKDHVLMPRRGMDIQLEAGVRRDLRLDEGLQRFVRGEMSFYYPLKILGKPVLATRIGAETNGGPYDFFNAATLGGRTNFRGISNERFIGKGMFYQNFDIRYKILSGKNYILPSGVGIVLSFDHGRIWEKNDNSKIWHYSYGGGIWMSPFEELVLSANYHISDTEKRFTILMGFFF